MQNQVDLTLMEFVEKQILPRYTAFGESHGLYHVTRVIKNSLELARMLGADINMAYAIAAYHDLGMEGPRAIHHITSGKILTADARLKKWFSPEQIKIMREAVEDHRASASHAPRSIYGKIVAEADRDSHMEEKYSNNGYINLWIPHSPNEKKLKELRDIIVNKELLRQYFDKIYDKIIAG